MKLIERMMKAKHELVFEILNDYRHVLLARAMGGDKRADIQLTSAGYGKRIGELGEYLLYPVKIVHDEHGELQIQSFEHCKEWYLRVAWDFE